MKTARWAAIGVIVACMMSVYVGLILFMALGVHVAPNIGLTICCGFVVVFLLASGVFIISDDMFADIRKWWRDRPWNAS